MQPYLTPLQIFENYKKANPQKCKGKSTTEICKLAGLNDKQIAELKTTSAWLFCFDRENTSINQDFSMTEIMGASFSKAPVKNLNNSIVENEQNIDGQIGNFNQGNIYDCRLLAQLNGLSYTSWGRKAIKNTIEPDGQGGAIVTFAGAKGKQKKFRVSKKELSDSYNLKKYSRGDDDVRAIEIACNKYLKTSGHSLKDGESVSLLSNADAVVLFLKDKIDSKVYHLLLGLSDKSKYGLPAEAIDNMLLHPDKYVAETGFRESLTFNDVYYCAHHAYTIKRIDYKEGKKYVVLTEPTNSSKEYYLEEKIFLRQNHGVVLYSLSDNSNFENSLLRKSTYDQQKIFVDNLTEGQRFLYMSEYTYKIINEINIRQFGWGQEKEQRKEVLMKPFIESVANEAKKCNINNTEIKKFKETCYTALNNKIYTKTEVIIKTVEEMVKQIKEHYENND